MAKKKKSTKKKANTAPVAHEPSPFWGYAGAVLLMLVAICVVVGGFGAGGPLPKALFQAAQWLFGYAGWILPVLLGVWGVNKFLGEERKVPRKKSWSLLATIVLASAWLFTATATKQPDGSVTGGHGGQVGAVLGGSLLSLFDKVPASILFFVCTLAVGLYTFGLWPSVIEMFRNMTARKENGDTDLAELKARAAATGFKLNEGVPVERHGAASAPEQPAPRLSSLRNTAQKLTVNEDHSALTAASDPNWQFPGVTLLDAKQDKADAGNVEGNARLIKETFGNFNIDVEMEGANIGPRVTQYTLKPPTGVKLTKITALENNLALDLAATSIRMEAPIPGKRAVGIEVPNIKPAIVRLSSILQSRDWTQAADPLTFAIGKDIAGKPVVANLAKMPHLLVAGQTGSGKSVMINTFLTSLLYRNSPSDLKLILVDPKQVEMAPY
ncbi:MAG TPA: DNA translocase FtsK 4TM domain-containing protein, partial [Candidatus Saccharimonadales bacterium]|nr:DNA translocase FtsK 4TM domain-containing protein [Candidatus Saccharimonadales bacterium]